MRSWFELIRVFNVPIPLAGIFVGACAADLQLRELWLVLPVAALVGCAATQCFNDYEDREIDAVNAAFRPIPSGGLEAREVLVGGHLFTIAWVLLSLLYSTAAAAIVVIVYLLTRWYSRVKQISLVHHLLLPAALGLMPAYGSLMVSGEVHALAAIAGVSIFLIDINMNIVGTFKDLYEGAVPERVLPVVWGPRPAVALALGVGLLGIAVQIIPVARGLCGPTPLIPLALGAALTVHSRVELLRSPCATVGYAALKSGRLTECLTFPALLAGLLPLRAAAFIIGALTFFALLAQTLLPEARLPEGAGANAELARS
ncbi:prenyltransferase [Enhygromyxa salina]|uniref:Prenyltransferase n=1 Tax=Enhygromyxa salina TaxID=215803 RepID=A0A2S9XJ00_9BACT|nr:UbiA family prenyltransferase [Enhygromyxa salina]PRP92854.1 prenyltransferase [Enhygromyxa salina]